MEEVLIYIGFILFVIIFFFLWFFVPAIVNCMLEKVKSKKKKVRFSK